MFKVKSLDLTCKTASLLYNSNLIFFLDEIIRFYALSREDSGANPELSDISEFGRVGPIKLKTCRVICVTLAMSAKLLDLKLGKGLYKELKRKSERKEG